MNEIIINNLHFSNFNKVTFKLSKIKEIIKK